MKFQIYTHTDNSIIVAPYAGAWIEIIVNGEVLEIKDVAPYAGAWIEIIPADVKTPNAEGRSLRGSVD